jgi:hypothetical protein
MVLYEQPFSNSKDICNHSNVYICAHVLTWRLWDYNRFSLYIIAIPILQGHVTDKNRFQVVLILCEPDVCQSTLIYTTYQSKPIRISDNHFEQFHRWNARQSCSCSRRLAYERRRGNILSTLRDICGIYFLSQEVGFKISIASWSMWETTAV